MISWDFLFQEDFLRRQIRQITIKHQIFESALVNDSIEFLTLHIGMKVFWRNCKVKKWCMYRR
jgi:hypothetical protein